MATKRGNTGKPFCQVSRLDEDSFFAKDFITLEDFKARRLRVGPTPSDLHVFCWKVFVGGHGQRDAGTGIWNHGADRT